MVAIVAPADEMTRGCAPGSKIASAVEFAATSFSKDPGFCHEIAQHQMYYSFEGGGAQKNVKFSQFNLHNPGTEVLVSKARLA
jgi:hypothetical protein